MHTTSQHGAWEGAARSSRGCPRILYLNSVLFKAPTDELDREVDMSTVLFNQSVQQLVKGSSTNLLSTMLVSFTSLRHEAVLKRHVKAAL
jgi:hypothetical protein